MYAHRIFYTALRTRNYFTADYVIDASNRSWCYNCYLITQALGVETGNPLYKVADFVMEY